MRENTHTGHTHGYTHGKYTYRTHTWIHTHKDLPMRENVAGSIDGLGVVFNVRAVVQQVACRLLGAHCQNNGGHVGRSHEHLKGHVVLHRAQKVPVSACVCACVYACVCIRTCVHVCVSVWKCPILR